MIYILSCFSILSIYRSSCVKAVYLSVCILTVLLPIELMAQEQSQEHSQKQSYEFALFQNSHFSGEFQTEMQYCFPDSAGDLSNYVKRFLSNSYLDLRYTSRMLDIGMRAEAYENPLVGFEQDYKGAGIPYFYLTLNLKSVQITVGDFYEQFGSGVILRSYYERALGLDNACLLYTSPSPRDA